MHDSQNKFYKVRISGTQWCSWLQHCATSRKVAGSIPERVFGIFNQLKFSSPIMVLGLTQPLTEMSIRCISCGVGGWRVNAVGA
jgi:hypothetical protein